MKRPLSSFLISSVLFLAASLAVVQAPSGAVAQEGTNQQKFDIGLIGDTRYTAEQKTKFVHLQDAMNAERLAFTVHDGDIKGGSSPCTNEIYTETFALFEQFKDPFIYTPGDNEWTDCHRAGGDPLERLALLRSTFYPDNLSLGEQTLTLRRQSAAFPENARWSFGQVTFATLHVVGSNNNLGRTPEADAEYAARNAANLTWLVDTFTEARAQDHAAVMLFMQANMFDGPADELTGFADTIAALRSETIRFGRPVVLVNGDSHYFRVDKPLLASATGRRIENFTRVETFGTDDVHWVRSSVDPRDPQVFTFRQEIVPANLVNHAL